MLCAITGLGSTAHGAFNDQSIKNQKNMTLAKIFKGFFAVKRLFLSLGLDPGLGHGLRSGG